MSFIEKIYKQALFSRHDDDGSVFYFSHKDFDGLKREPYSFVTKAGHKLNGAFYSYENPVADRIVVFDHGMGNGHRAYFREIETLARHGYLVYSYDHTGCTESEGEHIRGFAGSLADLDSCITALKKDFPEKSLSVIGHSWGGYSTLNITALHPDITHVVALSGFSSVKEMQKQVVPLFLRPFSKRLYDLEKDTNPAYVAHTAEQTLAKTKAKVLIIHSSDDKTVSAKRHFDRLRRVLYGRENISFLSLTGKDHNPNYTEDAVKYKNAFFKEYKRRRKAGLLATDEQKNEFISAYDWHRMTAQDEAVWTEIFKTLDG